MKTQRALWTKGVLQRDDPQQGACGSSSQRSWEEILPPPFFNLIQLKCLFHEELLLKNCAEL